MAPCDPRARARAPFDGKMRHFQFTSTKVLPLATHERGHAGEAVVEDHFGANICNIGDAAVVFRLAIAGVEVSRDEAHRLPSAAQVRS